VSAWLLIAAVGLAWASGLPGLWMDRRGDAGQRIATAMQLLATGLAGFVALGVLLGGSVVALRVPLNPLAASVIGLDALSAAFLLPVCLLCACASVFDLGYWPQSRHLGSGRHLRFWSGLMTGAMVLVLAAGDGIGFLVGWEAMALCSFFLIATEDHKTEVRRAAWVYLAATHVATLALFAFFALWQAHTGSFELTPAGGAFPPGLRAVMLLLALLGFGLKAGAVPLHFWLPEAHAAAPSHFSAVMSGVLIKIGVYGIARTCMLFGEPPLWWGQLLLGVGLLSTLFGVAFAIAQHDLKRMLAYHSVENIGIILLGLGLAVVGRASGRSELVVLGLLGALLHTWNHAIFKGLLFLAAGAAIHATGTRDLDRMGGLAQRMPWTAGAFLVGAVAISGLPPLNGFVSELLVYLGLFHSLAGTPQALAPVVIPGLALSGAMALLCFVKASGTVFLGQARSEAAGNAHEAARSMRLPMAVLAAACALIGLLPALVAPLLEPALQGWLLPGAQAPRLASLAPLPAIGSAGAVLLAGALLLYAWLRRRRASAASVPTWDCGYATPSPSMQYTASSFAQPFVSLSRWLLRPQYRPREAEPLFPRPSHFHSLVPDLVLDRLLAPLLAGLGRLCQWIRLLQRGWVNAYLLYIFVTLLVLLVLLVIR
jgi:hydrogenase-4 component B